MKGREKKHFSFSIFFFSALPSHALLEEVQGGDFTSVSKCGGGEDINKEKLVDEGKRDDGLTFGKHLY